MKQIYTKQKSANRHPKKYNFDRFTTLPISERRRQGLFGPDWFEFNEKHFEEYKEAKKQLGIPDTFVAKWVEGFTKEEREAIRNAEEHPYKKYLDVLPTEEEIEKAEQAANEVLNPTAAEEITTETNA